jgi:glycogen operon protein
VPEALRGTYAGLSEPAVLDGLKTLGVTAIELLPIHGFISDSYLVEKGLTNYWGYNTLAFFAPDRSYAASPEFAFAEFKEMIAHVHAAGMEVVLDVVYNHTPEGNEKGPTLSMKGIDNASYYRLADDPRFYINDTGTGNTVNLSNSRVLQLVMDSLRYWATEMRVDGVPFRPCHHPRPRAARLRGAGPLPRRVPAGPGAGGREADRRALGLRPGGYQVGQFAPGWAEWNDRFRDTVRAFWRGDEGMVPELSAVSSARRTSSTSAVAGHGRPSTSSPPMMASLSLTSCPTPTSTTRRTGRTIATATRTICRPTTASRARQTTRTSTRCGQRQMRNMLATLILSRGTPMLLAGDERGRTQGGNNNAYARTTRRLGLTGGTRRRRGASRVSPAG